MNRSSESDEGDDVFKQAPNWNFNDDKVKFDTNDVSDTNDNYGSSSAFLTKSLLKKDVLLKNKASFYSLDDLIQPPSMRPISSISDSNTV